MENNQIPQTTVPKGWKITGIIFYRPINPIYWSFCLSNSQVKQQTRLSRM